MHFAAVQSPIFQLMACQESWEQRKSRGVSMKFSKSSREHFPAALVLRAAVDPAIAERCGFSCL